MAAFYLDLKHSSTCELSLSLHMSVCLPTVSVLIAMMSFCLYVCLSASGMKLEI